MMTTNPEIDYARCLVFLYPTAQWSISGNDYSTLNWLSDSPKPTEEEIIASWSDAYAAFMTKVSNREAEKNAILDRIGVTSEELRKIFA
jgi:hypothetical protein